FALPHHSRKAPHGTARLSVGLFCLFGCLLGARLAACLAMIVVVVVVIVVMIVVMMPMIVIVRMTVMMMVIVTVSVGGEQRLAAHLFVIHGRELEQEVHDLL